NFGKQVMLYLEIEPAYQPADKPVVGGKVGRGLELVYGPFIFHFPGKFIGHGEMRMLYRMGQLENDAQYKAGYQAYGQESDKPGNGANEKDRQHYKKKCMRQLVKPEQKMIAEVHFLQRDITNL